MILHVAEWERLSDELAVTFADRDAAEQVASLVRDGLDPAAALDLVEFPEWPS